MLVMVKVMKKINNKRDKINLKHLRKIKLIKLNIFLA